MGHTLDGEKAETAAAEQSRRIYQAIPELGRLRDTVLFGDVWRQPELSARDRSIATCALLAAFGRKEELGSHVEMAIRNGVTPNELRGLAVHLAFYAGWPAARSLGAAALGILEGHPPQS